MDSSHKGILLSERSQTPKKIHCGGGGGGGADRNQDGGAPEQGLMWRITWGV